MDLDWVTVFLLLGTAGLGILFARASLFEWVHDRLNNKSLKCAHCMGFVFGLVVYFLYNQLWYWEPTGWLLTFVFAGLSSLIAYVIDILVYFVRLKMEYIRSELAFMEKSKMREENKKREE